jgi:hypothetical protein
VLERQADDVQPDHAGITAMAAHRVVLETDAFGDSDVRPEQ